MNEDYISREEAKEYFENVPDLQMFSKGFILKYLSALPSRPKGEWLQQQGENGDDYFEAWDISGVHTYAARYKCSICGFIQYCIEDHGHYHFCPNCGAGMYFTEEVDDADNDVATTV